MLAWPLASQHASHLEHCWGCDGRKEGNLPVFHQIRILTLLLFVSDIHWSKIPVTWREHEHEEEDMLALHDPVTVNALRNCGLFKFFRISSMRQQINLL